MQAGKTRGLEMFSRWVVAGGDLSHRRANRRPRCRPERSLEMRAFSRRARLLPPVTLFDCPHATSDWLTSAAGRASLPPPPGAMVATGEHGLSLPPTRASFLRCLQPCCLLHCRVRVPLVARPRSLQAHFTRVPNKPLQLTAAALACWDLLPVARGESTTGSVGSTGTVTISGCGRS